MKTEEPPKKYLVSVTHLHVKSIWGFPEFLYHSGMNFYNIWKFEGLIKTKFLRYGYTFCTMSVWTAKSLMSQFNRSKVHMAAVKSMGNYCDEGIHGHIFSDSPEYEDWDKMHDFLLEKGHVVKLPGQSERQKQGKWPRPPKLSKSKLINFFKFREIHIPRLAKTKKKNLSPES